MTKDDESPQMTTTATDTKVKKPSDLRESKDECDEEGPSKDAEEGGSCAGEKESRDHSDDAKVEGKTETCRDSESDNEKHVAMETEQQIDDTEQQET